jgi:L-amino acid N-acyltransferase YncA
MALLQARRATAQDLDALRRLGTEAATQRTTLLGTRRFDPDAWAAGRAPTVVVGEGASPAGFAVALTENIPAGAPRCAEVLVYVAATHRRRGAARAALTELLTVARTMGLWKLVASSLPEDAGSRALLARLDFRDVGTLVKHLQIEGSWRDVVLSERLVLAARKSLPSIPEM